MRSSVMIFYTLSVLFLLTGRLIPHYTTVAQALPILSQSGDDKTDIGKSTILIRVLVLGGVAICILAVALWRARKGPVPLGPQAPEKESEVSKLVLVKYETIIANMRAGTWNQFYLALQDLAFLPVYSDEVISEIAMAVARKGRYSSSPYSFLGDGTWRCRLVRFLHLALERNRQGFDGVKIVGFQASFQDIYYDKSLCYSLCPTRSWVARFVREIKRLLNGMK